MAEALNVTSTTFGARNESERVKNSDAAVTSRTPCEIEKE
jgi:hypothetical protein